VGPAPVANYVPYVQSGNLVFVAGQIPLADGKVRHTGILGDSVEVEEGRAAARLCALNVVAQVKAACGGDLDRVVRCVRLGGYVSSTGDFGDHPAVVNGASDTIVEIFGVKGRLGENLAVEDGAQAARLVGLGLLATLRDACGGDLDRVGRCVRLYGLIRCTPEFTAHATVMNGASDLMVEVFGDAGLHARTTIGARALPSGIAVEIEGLFELR
jgi:enamine deaminase RidA (YjgF/YER057c/UK114 family)